MSTHTLSRQEIVAALERLGQLAQAGGEQLELLIIGGACMVLAYDARQSTRDVDAVVLSTTQMAAVRGLVRQVAEERGWPEDWLNDAAKGYLFGLSETTPLLSAPGIQASRPSVAQLLAMKLCAWRDDLDISDAAFLLNEMLPAGDQDMVWKMIEPYLVPGRELKANYAFLDLWEAYHGDN
jgi:hypothetical protein